EAGLRDALFPVGALELSDDLQGPGCDRAVGVDALVQVDADEAVAVHHVADALEPTRLIGHVRLIEAEPRQRVGPGCRSTGRQVAGDLVPHADLAPLGADDGRVPRDGFGQLA